MRPVKHVVDTPKAGNLFRWEFSATSAPLLDSVADVSYSVFATGANREPNDMGCAECNPLAGIFRVAPTTNRTEIFRNGVSLGNFETGQVWSGPTSDFDEFRASEPIYGVIEYPGLQPSRTQAMVPESFKGRSFVFGNTRRISLGFYIRTLDSAASCSIFTRGDHNAGVGVVVDHTGDIAAYSGHLFVSSTDGNHGDSSGSVVTCTSDVVVTVQQMNSVVLGTPGQDHLQLLPPATRFIGIPSTELVLARACPDPCSAVQCPLQCAAPITVTRECTDGSAESLSVTGGVSGVLKIPGFAPDFSDVACVLSSTEPFHAQSQRPENSEGLSIAGGVPFLPISTDPPLLSTKLVTATNYEYIAFAAQTSGECNVATSNGTVLSVALVSDCGTGVCKGRAGGGAAGTLVSCTMPVWAVIASAATADEQLLYGNLPPASRSVPQSFRVRELTPTTNGECALCEAGWVPSDDRTTCEACPAGKQAPDSVQCVACVAGYYAASEGTPECLACPVGQYNVETQRLDCDDCSAGTYVRVTGSTADSACIQCVLGKYSLAGAEYCSSCPVGQTTAAVDCARDEDTGAMDCSVDHIRGASSPGNCTGCPWVRVSNAV
eukprot:SAG11_NODE_191_length_12943_cov_3.853706_10_plen_606_part_00